MFLRCVYINDCREKSHRLRHLGRYQASRPWLTELLVTKHNAMKQSANEPVTASVLGLSKPRASANSKRLPRTDDPLIAFRWAGFREIYRPLYAMHGSTVYTRLCPLLGIFLLSRYSPSLLVTMLKRVLAASDSFLCGLTNS